MRRIGYWAVALLGLASSESAFSKEALPGGKDAAKLAAAWLRAVADDEVPEAVLLSGYPFRAIGFEGRACKGDKTAQEESALRGIVECAQQEVGGEFRKDDLAVLNVKDLKRAGWNQNRKHLRVLMRQERLVWRIFPGEDVLHVVVMGVRATPDGPRVTSLTYRTDTLETD